MSERVLFYGSRTWVDSPSILRVVAGLPPDGIVICGGASGADWIAQRAARRYGLNVEVYPADWKRYGKRAGPLRNQQMLDSGIDRAYGFRAAGESRGTDDMTRRLVEAGIPHVVDAR